MSKEDKFLIPGLGTDNERVANVINYVRDACYENALNHGFWDDENNIISYINKYGPYDKQQEIEKRIIGLFNSEKVALEHSELSERLETLRKDPTKMDEHCPDFLNIEIEVADLIIRALDFAGRRNLRIGEAMIAKMKFNSSRPFMHGKKF